MVTSEELRSELFFLIGRLHQGSTAGECLMIRKAAELFALCRSLRPLKADSLLFRRNRLGLSQDSLAALCALSLNRLEVYEQVGGPAWIGLILDVLEERRRDEARRSYAGISFDPERDEI